MSKLILFFLIIFSVNISFSQPWMKLIPEEKITNGQTDFYEIQEAFNTYWKDKKVERSHGWKQFKRWENFMAPRVYPSGKLPQNILWDEIQNGNNEKSNVANWIPMGPYATPADINTTNYKRGSGRVNCMAFHPTDLNILFAGSPSGGFWKSTTGGSSWITTTDQLSSIGISDIAVNPSNPEIIYIATGDGDGGNTYSAGIMKSTDGGVTWNVTGNSHQVTDYITYKKLIIHPSNNNILLASSNNGIYKTTNGGSSWILSSQGDFKDICFKPGNPNVVYAADPQQIYKSVDGGNSFSPVSSGINSGNVSRIALAVTSANPEYIYALCSGNDGGFYGVYKSTNSGNTWSETVNSSYGNLLGWASDGSGSGGQGWYDLTIAVSPLDANIVFTGGVNIWKSLDGGYSWDINAHWYGDNGVAYVHADQHYFAYNPLTNELFSGNDGGLHKTINGTDWTDLSDGLQILQMYRIGLAATNPNVVVTGTQDNGSMKYDNGNWWATIGGDGMECLVDYSDEKIMYAEYYYGAISKSIDGGYNFFDIKPPLSPNGAWVTPYVIHPTDHNTLFMGFDDVYKTTDGGINWTTISQYLTGGINLQSLAIAQSNSNYLYAATGDQIYRTTNGGSSWDYITSGLPGNYITYITISSSNPLKIWITLSGYTNGQKVYASTNGGNTWTNYSTGLPNLPANCITYEDNTNDALYVGTDVGVYYRNAGMTQWMQFSTGLPNVIVDELEIQYATRKLRAATYGRGLWESDLYEVPAVPNAAFIYQATSICEGIINFYNSSTGVPSQYQWYFGDGGSSTVINPSHAYVSPGTYPVKLIVSNTFGTDSVLINVNLSVLPVNAGFTADNAVSCSTPAMVHFLNSSVNGLSYLWYFGDGAVSTEENPDHSYLTSGFFDVKLVVNGGFCGADSVVYAGIVNINPVNSGNQSMPLTSGVSAQTCCSGTLYDSGGQGYYQNNTHSVITISPFNASQVSLSFISFDFEAGPNGTCGYDYLALYDGSDISAPLIGMYCNNAYPPTNIISTGGSITLEQYADPGVTGTGFELNWNCIPSSVSALDYNPNMILVYPNPSDGNFVVLANNTMKNSTLRIFNINGKIIYEIKIMESGEIPIMLTNRAQGLYLVQLISDCEIINKIISVE